MATWEFYELFFNFFTLFPKETFFKKSPISAHPLHVCAHAHTWTQWHKYWYAQTFLYSVTERIECQAFTYLLYLFQQIFQTLTSLPAQRLQCYENNSITNQQNNTFLKRANNEDKNYLQVIKTMLKIRQD